jgi:aminoglycoside phosphotransferase (APT) family kinase protein|tara:strand:- start:137 stop:322 length:186 start_codon:yes stop_codon:yes gene_type:complete
MSTVYYKMDITKKDMFCTIYHKEKTYKKFKEFVEALYKLAKVDAVELELVSKEEYYKHELV